MARPRAAGYEIHRDQIRSAAAALFARLGYTAATMSGVAAASGVSKATLYHYFSDKHALLEDIVSTHVARLEQLVAQPLPPPADHLERPADARLRELVGRFMQAYQGAQNEHRVLTEDVKFLEPRAREAVLEGQRRVVTAFAQGIAACRPELDPALHKPLAMLVFGMINWTFTWLKPDGGLTHEALGEIAADLLLGGLPAVQGAGAAVVGSAPRRRPRSVAETADRLSG
jgi:TetR/AcrR family transcriptional regulator